MVPAHDAFTCLLHRLEPDTATLWSEAAGFAAVLIVSGTQYSALCQLASG